MFSNNHPRVATGDLHASTLTRLSACVACENLLLFHHLLIGEKGERERERERDAAAMKNAFIFRIPHRGNAVLPVPRNFLANRIALSLIAAEAKRELASCVLCRFERSFE